MTEELVAAARRAYGWSARAVATRGPRGALGQIWRVDDGPTRYALKEIFAAPPTAEQVAVELTYTRRAAEAGVRLPASLPDREGRHVVPTPGGTWLRLYDWVDVRPLDLTAQSTPHAVGVLLARLHRCAPATAVEAGGAPPDAWYHQVPTAHAWDRVPAVGTAWAARLADRLASLPDLTREVTRVVSGRLVVCHRDLHPGNVLAEPTGDLVVVDWDSLGPAAPERELARALFDWCCDGPDADFAGMRRMYEAYLRHGGPGRIVAPADFSMLVASRLNFLLRQLHVAVDPATEGRHREWAEQEIDEALRILPTPEHLAAVLELAASVR
ncbi:phosphotransferase enzyme family protein [Micromonospora sagamiensis]|uniref:Ser/Thr protein kinase RdoA (MazF antagonist) n=1 Tax=Micromonospora sagamiensis TaxID=47875 RepID=A0A562W9Q2_9ACTN|nr:phosphotransferase [Micromonospora sagamiensis]TWJ26990.1 Ser/Thr protein kinase RdoA (MazF antagonist) [Micromonospora sagamiensis]